MSELASKIAKAGLFVGGKLSADKTNKDQAYDYISADKINAICGQALYREGVAVLPEVTNQETVLFEYTDNYNKTKRRYDSTVTLKFIISDGSESIETAWVGVGSDYVVPDKAVYKAITSGHKYFLMKLLCVGAGNEDGEHEPEPADHASNGKAAKVQKQAEQPVASTNKRPYLPAVVRMGIQEKAKRHSKAGAPNDAQIKLLRYGLELCFAGDANADDKRHVLLGYLTGDASTKAISGPMFKAIVEDWLKMTKDSGGDYTIDPMAAKEAQSIVSAALVEEGQQTLAV